MDSINAIPSQLPEPQTAASAVKSVSVAQQVADAATKAATDDTVHLSAQAQAERMYRLGDTETEIARTLNSTMQIVDGYLGLTLEKQLKHTLEPPLEA